jgi:hypothetical protein
MRPHTVLLISLHAQPARGSFGANDDWFPHAPAAARAAERPLRHLEAAFAAWMSEDLPR